MTRSCRSECFVAMSSAMMAGTLSAVDRIAPVHGEQPSDRIRPGESIRVFPLSNWTELDVWHYIQVEQIPVVPLYFAQERDVVVRGSSLMLREQEFVPLLPGERTERVMCRMRSLGCSPCTGAVRSTADTVPKIIEELISVRQSERQLRVIDHDQDGSMEMKKREGYF